VPTRDLLAILPRLYNKDPEADIALAISAVSGTFTARVDGTLLELVATGAIFPVPPFAVDLRDYTLGTLAQAIQAAGYLAVALDGWADLAATVLIDGFYEPAGSHKLLGYTATLWRVIRPLALVFDLWSDDLHHATKMMDVRYAEGRWLDWWGILYGVPRVDGETDAQYRRRIVREVMAPRANGVAMEAILKDALGYESTITDVAVGATTWYTATGRALFTTSGSASECYTSSPPGLNTAAPPPLVNTAGVAAPTTPPILASYAAPATGLPAGVYSVVFTVVTASGETTASPPATLVLPAGYTIGHQTSYTPGGATAYKFYVAMPGLTWDQSSGASYNTTTYAWTTTDPNVLTWGLANPTSTARPTTVWSVIPPLTEPTIFARTFPGLPGFFDVAIRQVVEDGAIGIAAIRSLIERYKAAGFQFTLSVLTAYRDEYATDAIGEYYTEVYSGGYAHFAGSFYITGTMASLTALLPERPTVYDASHLVPLGLGGTPGLGPRVPAASAPLPVWEASIYEEYNVQGQGWVPLGQQGTWAIFPDPARVQARGLGGIPAIWRLAPPGVLPTG
jgi:hypothetical protein